MIAIRTFALCVLVAALVAVGPTAGRAEAKVKAGTITINTKSVGFIIGIEWGSGELRLNNGRTYRLRIRTLKAGMIGLEAVTAHGNVYNLRRATDIEVKFFSAGAGITVGGGVGVQNLKNSKDVIIELKETAQGIAGKIAASGIDIQLR